MASSNPPTKLFAEFAKSSLNDWYTLAKQSLKSDDFIKLNKNKNFEGLPVKSFYAANNSKKKTTKNDVFSYTSSGKSWVFQEIVHLPESGYCKAANRTAMSALHNSVESLIFDISAHKLSQEEIDIMLKGISRDAINISWIISSLDKLPDLGRLNTMSGVLYLNPLERYITVSQPYQIGLKKMEELLKANPSTYKCLGVSGYPFANSGATILQEVALTCNLLVEYLHYFTDIGIPPQVLFNHLEVTLSTRSSYLADIAKYRAMAELILILAEAYEAQPENVVPIRALSAKYNKVYFDHHTNLIRNTTEALGAVLGNCQTICLLPHTSCQNNNDAFGKRMARNVAHLLHYESHLNLVQDPLSGAYAIEEMTDEIVKQAWPLFLNIEEKGGLMATFESGYLQHCLQQSASEYQHGIATLQRISVGANRFVPTETKTSDEMGNSFQSTSIDQGVSKLTEIRGPAVIESVRSQVDQIVSSGKSRPSVGVLRFSSDSRPAVVASRLSFVKDIFNSIGMHTVYFPDAIFLDEQNLQKVFKSVNACVIIGDDQAYQSAVARVFWTNSGGFSVPLLIAGLPDNLVRNQDKLGIHAFVHAEMNVPAFAKQFLSAINFFDHEA